MTTSVLISGGAGYLGRGILRRVYERGELDWQITVFSRDEAKQNECRRRYPQARYILGDVCDTDRLTAVAAGHDVIIHAAAVKYIPEAEENPGECVRVNVDGTRSVIQAARRAGVGQVVGISTDKAIRPLNVYGMTKALSERLFAEAGAQSSRHSENGPRFNTVRYGNVVGSTGSVIPLFEYQLKRDGFVTLTDPKMTRFWMPVDAAIDCILAAMNTANINGSTIVPRPMAMNMGALAAALAGEAVKIVGPRPGEKQDEELMHASESVWMRRHGSAYYETMPRGLSKEPLPEVYAPVTLASHTPAGGWVTPEQLREWIADAHAV